MNQRARSLRRRTSRTASVVGTNPASTYALFAHAAQTYGNAPALTHIADATDFRSTATWTFRELLAKVTQAANAFSAAGVTARDVVAYALPNLPETHFALWGAEAAAIALAINPALPGEQIADLLRAAGARILVTTAVGGAVDPLRAVAPHLPNCPALTHVFTVGAGDVPALGSVTIRSFAQAMDEQPKDFRVSRRRLVSASASSWFCTGGTTGAPKIACRTHGSEVANATMIGRSLGRHAGPGRTFFCGLPLFHVNAAMITGLVPWLAGSHVVLGPANGYRDKALIANFWRMVAAHRINVFSGVPTLFGTLLEVPIAGCDVGSLDFAICGAAPMPAELFRRFEKATGIRILEAYGLTESACVATLNPIDGERRIGSIGLPLPEQDARCVILDDAGRYVRDAAIDEVGIVALAGPNIFGGYKSEHHNEGLWIDVAGHRLMNTGDLGRKDADGYLWLTGRKKQLIIRGGHNIDPATIEELLHRHPDVALAAAVGRPDPHAGEVPVAYVQLRTDARADEATLLAFAAQVIGERAAVPKAVRIVREIPVTPVGKIFKPALVMREIEDVVRQEANAAGIGLRALAVHSDARRGLVATVTPSAPSSALRAALGRYAFAADIADQ